MRFALRQCISLFIITLIVCSSLSACVLFSPSGPQDLALYSLEVVDMQDAPGRQRHTPFNAPHIKTLKAGLSSRVDLVKLVRGREFSVYNEIFIGCGKVMELFPADSTAVHEPAVYWSDFDESRIGIFGDSDEPDLSRLFPSGQPFVYRVSFNIEGQPARHNIEPLRPYYNLGEHPQDVCIRIGGGDVLGRTFVSNTVLIPSSMVESALKQARSK